MPSALQKAYKWIVLSVGIIQLIIGISIYLVFKPLAGIDNLNEIQFVEKVSWINLDLSTFGKISAEYFIGIDGLSITMVLLTILIMLIAVVSAWNHSDRAKGFFSLLLILNGAIVGCFVALDFLLFYLFFEFMLLPMYFLIGLWGGPKREYASVKFFLYTLLGSILILIVMIALNLSTIDPVRTAVSLNLAEEATLVDQHMITQVQSMLQQNSIPSTQLVHTFSLTAMTDVKNIIPGSILDINLVKSFLGYPIRLLAFLLLFIGFAIKMPVVPLHTWLPDAHVEAPTSISVILAGVLLKVGAYGLIRTGILIFPEGLIHYAWWLGALGVLSIIYGAMNALASTDIKRLIAYSSVSHMGFVLLGMAAITSEGLSGSIYQMVSHGIISAALFLIAGVIYDRTHNRMIENYSGLAAAMPKYTVVVIIFFFASMGLPGFSGFMAEVFVLLGAFASTVIPKWMMMLATIGLILAAAYYLWTIQRMFFGKLHTKAGINTAQLTDLTAREWLMFIPLILMTLLLGIFPNLILKLINTSVNHMIELVSAGEGVLKLIQL